ncbi:ankyrin repeat-containing domain protein [Trichoderma sp. SZMC 28013]
MLRLFNQTKDYESYILRPLNHLQIFDIIVITNLLDSKTPIITLQDKSQRSGNMEQCSSDTAESAPACLGFDVFDRVLTRYMDDPQDILNFCLANKEYYGFYIDTLYRHNVRYDESFALEWAAERGRLDLVSILLNVPQVEVFAPKAIWHRVLRIAQKQNNVRLAELLFEKQYVQDFIKLAAAIKDGREVDRSQQPTTTPDDEESDDDREAREQAARDQQEAREQEARHAEFLLKPMFGAAKHNQRRLVELYLSHVSVDLQNSNGLTLLHRAAGMGHFDLAQYLLEEHGANPEIRRDGVGFRPIEVAAHDNQPRLVELLLSKGADPRWDGGGFCAGLTSAATHGYEAIAKLFLKDRRIDPRIRDTNGESCLELAVIYGSTGIVKMLLEDGRVDPNEQNDRDETPLGLAAQGCRHDIVFLLLDDDRVDPNGKHTNGTTPLLAASSSNGPDSVPIIEMLLEDSRVDVCARDDDGCNACLLAAKRGILCNVLTLLQHPHIDPNQENNDKKTAAIYAAAGYQQQAEATPVYLRRNKHFVLKALIEDERVDLNKVDDSGLTAMHWAIRNNRKENVRLLAGSGRFDVNLDGGAGRPALIEACILKSSSMTEILLGCGGVDLSKRNADGETPLMFAIWKAGRENLNIQRSIWLILDNERCNRLDLRYGNGLTILEAAVQAGAKEIVKMLLFTCQGPVTPRAKELCSQRGIREMLDEHRNRPSRLWTKRDWWKWLGIWQVVLFLHY